MSEICKNNNWQRAWYNYYDHFGVFYAAQENCVQNYYSVRHYALGENSYLYLRLFKYGLGVSEVGIELK